MDNLPTTFEGLLNLLHQFRDECTDPDLKTTDIDTLGVKLDALLDQYEAKLEQPNDR